MVTAWEQLLPEATNYPAVTFHFPAYDAKNLLDIDGHIAIVAVKAVVIFAAVALFMLLSGAGGITSE